MAPPMGSSSYFNSRPCERGDRRHWHIGQSLAHFNSRPCERGDDKLVQEGKIVLPISIHAPARGATRYGGNLQSPGKISIHAPARGATPAALASFEGKPVFQFTPLREGRPRCGLPLLQSRTNFNSRPCERGDAYSEKDYPVFLISIHAPARGATCSQTRINECLTYFNSRPCERGDQEVLTNKIWLNAFQFTPLREGRQELSRI